WAMRRPGARPSAPSPELDSESGAIVCICRSVGEAEVAAALSTPTPITTTDALKRRCGVGFGDCQGNRCAADAIARIAAARGIAPEAVEKGPVGSWLLEGSGGTQAAEIALRHPTGGSLTRPDSI